MLVHLPIHQENGPKSSRKELFTQSTDMPPNVRVPRSSSFHGSRNFQNNKSSESLVPDIHTSGVLPKLTSQLRTERERYANGEAHRYDNSKSKLGNEDTTDRPNRDTRGKNQQSKRRHQSTGGGHQSNEESHKTNGHRHGSLVNLHNGDLNEPVNIVKDCTELHNSIRSFAVKNNKPPKSTLKQISNKRTPQTDQIAVYVHDEKGNVTLGTELEGSSSMVNLRSSTAPSFANGLLHPDDCFPLVSQNQPKAVPCTKIGNKKRWTSSNLTSRGTTQMKVSGLLNHKSERDGPTKGILLSRSSSLDSIPRKKRSNSIRWGENWTRRYWAGNGIEELKPISSVLRRRNSVDSYDTVNMSEESALSQKQRSSRYSKEHLEAVNAEWISSIPVKEVVLDDAKNRNLAGIYRTLAGELPLMPIVEVSKGIASFLHPEKLESMLMPQTFKIHYLPLAFCKKPGAISAGKYRCVKSVMNMMHGKTGTEKEETLKKFKKWYQEDSIQNARPSIDVEAVPVQDQSIPNVVPSYISGITQVNSSPKTATLPILAPLGPSGDSDFCFHRRNTDMDGFPSKPEQFLLPIQQGSRKDSLSIGTNMPINKSMVHHSLPPIQNLDEGVSNTKVSTFPSASGSSEKALRLPPISQSYHLPGLPPRSVARSNLPSDSYTEEQEKSDWRDRKSKIPVIKKTSMASNKTKRDEWTIGDALKSNIFGSRTKSSNSIFDMLNSSASKKERNVSHGSLSSL